MLKKGCAAVHEVLPQWSNKGNLNTDLVLEVAVLVQDPDLASKLIENLDLDTLSSKLKSKFLKLLEAYGEKWVLTHLESWRKRNHSWNGDTFTTKNLVALVEDLSKDFKPVSSWLLEYQFAEVQDDIKRNSKASLSTITYAALQNLDKSKHWF